MASRIKNPHKANKGKSISTIQMVEMPDYSHPVFCLRYLHNKFCLQQCDLEEKAAFAERLALLSQMTWMEISQQPRHGLGWEKLPVGQIAAQKPAFITPDVNHLLVLRYHANKPFVGHKNRFIFHVLFIEKDWTLYDHGNK